MKFFSNTFGLCDKKSFSNLGPILEAVSWFCCQILSRQAEIPQKTRKKYQPKFLLVFSGSAVTKSQVYLDTNTQKLNRRCQELNPAHFTVLLVPTRWIFTPHSEILPCLECFTSNGKSVINTIIIGILT